MSNHVATLREAAERGLLNRIADNLQVNDHELYFEAYDVASMLYRVGIGFMDHLRTRRVHEVSRIVDLIDLIDDVEPTYPELLAKSIQDEVNEYRPEHEAFIAKEIAEWKAARGL